MLSLWTPNLVISNLKRYWWWWVISLSQHPGTIEVKVIMASVKTCSFLSPPIVYICSWDLNISCKLKCSLNPTVLFPSLDEYRRIENNVRKPLRLFLDLFVNGFPSPTLAKFLLKLITKGCKTCPLHAVGSDFGWREGLPRFNCSVKQIASLSLQRAQFYAHVKLWLWFKEKSGSWRV